jgi:PhzF family phenazine biosynthesis protein
VTTTPLQVHRLAAFTDDPAGGNPAGVVLTDAPLPDATMQQVAVAVGYSETAFLSLPSGDRCSWQVRYFSPADEVPFCGHATIAAGVLLGQQAGTGSFSLETASGTVRVEVERCRARLTAALTSVTPLVEPASTDLVAEVLEVCGLDADHLDVSYPPAVAFAGARHLLLVLRDRADLAELSYDFDRLREQMLDAELTTVAYLCPDPDGGWHARNLFPVGGVVEDPATGAAAAAFGAYLRDLGAVAPPTSFEIRQGEDLGRPSRLQVTVPADVGGIEVAGTAVELGAPLEVLGGGPADRSTAQEGPRPVPPGIRRARSGSPYEDAFGFSRAVRVGATVHVSGTGPVWPDGSCDPDAGGQARRCFEIIAAALAEVGGSLEDVVRTRMYVTDTAVADAVGRVHGEVFGATRPAATLVVVAGLVDPRWSVEVEAEAHLSWEDG